MSTSYHPQTDGQSERTIQTLEDMLHACVLDFGKGWDRYLPLVDFRITTITIPALRLHPLRRCIDASVDHLSAGLKLEIVNSLAQRSSTRQLRRSFKSKSRIQTARDRQKSYADVRGKPLEFQVGDKIIAKLGTVAYRLELPVSRFHSMFHVSNLKKCMSDEPLAIPLDEIQVDNKLHFIEEPVEIMDHEVKRLKQNRIPIVKVRWNYRRGPDFTWEREDQMQKKCPHLFVNLEPSSNAKS
ncbi:putative reverse transcriptase domain-containing protein [Tanacetum coccineum]